VIPFAFNTPALTFIPGYAPHPDGKMVGPANVKAMNDPVGAGKPFGPAVTGAIVVVVMGTEVDVHCILVTCTQ